MVDADTRISARHRGHDPVVGLGISRIRGADRDRCCVRVVATRRRPGVPYSRQQALALHLLLHDPLRGAMNLCRERLNAIEQLQLLVLHLEQRGPLPSGELIQPRVHGCHV
jgi:hypothetical protein